MTPPLKTVLGIRIRESAFTLVELLVVVAIIGVLATLVTPAVTTMMKGSQLTQASQMLHDQLAFARQSALTKNRPVEVRFYRYGDPEMPGEKASEPGSGRFRALQCFEILDDGTASALTKVQKLPASVVLDSGSTLSPLIAKPKTWTATDQAAKIPRVGTSYECRVFRFLPDGSTDLPKGSSLSFVTLHGFNDGDLLTKPPANYATIQVDAYNGHIRSFRP